jgi:hypothetical protein
MMPDVPWTRRAMVPAVPLFLVKYVTPRRTIRDPPNQELCGQYPN